MSSAVPFTPRRPTPPWPGPAIDRSPRFEAMHLTLQALIDTLEGSGQTVFLIAPEGGALFLSSAARRVLGPSIRRVFTAIREWRLRMHRSRRASAAPRGMIRVPHETHRELLITLGMIPAHGLMGGSVVATVHLRTHARSRRDPDVPLTAREQDVAALIRDGLSYEEIAFRLGVTLHTVRRHTERIFAKYGVHSRARLMAFLHP